jgi:hypothetical protein
MAQTHFERLVEEKKAELMKSAMAISAEQSHRIADIQGQYKGLEESLALYRQAARTDADRDDI